VVERSVLTEINEDVMLCYATVCIMLVADAIDKERCGSSRWHSKSATCSRVM